MTLHSQARLDILLEAKRDAVIHAKVWMDIARHLEKQIAEESTTRSINLGPVNFGIQWPDDSKSRQGDYLPRNGERDKSVRYHRGSKASDEGTLRQ